MEVVTKEATASVVPVESTHPNGEFDLILSTADLDRDGENLYADDWGPLPEHLHFDTDHAFNRNESVPFTAGSGVPRIEDGQLRVRGTYAGTAHGQLTRQLVNEGHIRSASVAYSEHKDGTRELLNGSFVGVPANPHAKILSSKAMKAASDDTPPPEEDEDDDMPSPDQLVQAAHDAMVHLGADCYSPDADDGESDGANKSFSRRADGLLAAVLKGSYTIDEARKLVFKKSSDSESVGSPQESPDTTTPAPVVKTAAAVDESADDVAQRTRASAKAFLLKQSMRRILDDD